MVLDTGETHAGSPRSTPVPTCADCEEDTVATHTHSTFCSHPGALSWPGRHTDGASGSMIGRGIPASVPVCRKPVAIRRILPMHIRCTIVRRQRSRPPDALDILGGRWRLSGGSSQGRRGGPCDGCGCGCPDHPMRCRCRHETCHAPHGGHEGRIYGSVGIADGGHLSAVLRAGEAASIHRFMMARDGSGAHGLSGKETVRRRGPLPFGVHAPDDRAATRECVDTTRRAWHHW